MAAANLRKLFLASFPPPDCLGLLVVGQIERAAKTLAVRLGAAAVNAPICDSTLWPSVDTRA